MKLIVHKVIAAAPLFLFLTVALHFYSLYIINWHFNV